MPAGHQPALFGGGGVGERRVEANPAPGPAGKLARRDGSAPHDGGDLLERDREAVVQHERQALGRLQGVQYDQQRQAHRVGEECLVLGRSPCRLLRRCLRGNLLSALPDPEHVEAHPGHHRRKPSAEVVDGGGVGAAEAQPRLLDGVVGLLGRAEHPQRHRPQVGPLALELPGEQVAVAHGHILSAGVVLSHDETDRVDVTRRG